MVARASSQQGMVIIKMMFDVNVRSVCNILILQTLILIQAMFESENLRGPIHILNHMKPVSRSVK